MTKNEAAASKDGSDVDVHSAVAAVAAALNELLADRDLALANPSEWSITYELAVRMAPRFPGWRVSSEWDRREREEKQIAWDDEAGRRLLKSIRPDIVVHHILKQENLLVVEAKRSSHRGNYADDVRKLVLMTKSMSVDPNFHYGYKVGLHVVINLPDSAVESAQVYVDGEVDPDITAFFRDRIG